MATRYMNEAAMKIIIAVQALKKFTIADEITHPEQNWYERVHSYYFSLPANLVKESGLRKNEHDFGEVLDFQVTDEMLSTNFVDLGKFTLWPA